MVIEFLLNEIEDKAKLYKEELIKDSTPFSYEPQTFPSSMYIGKEYCIAAMDVVKSNISSIQKCEYKGAIDRIANEVFELITDKYIYTVPCTIDTYPKDKTRMLVKIASENIDGNSDEFSETPLACYDQTLEKLKLEVKNIFKNDWKSCIWIKDEQSEFLCSLLYPYIFRAENRLRAFVNKVLIWELGSDWIDSFGLEKYSESHKKLSEDFRRLEPAFSNIDDVFISATLETLFEIIKQGIVYESPFTISKEQYNSLVSVVYKSKSASNIIEWLNKRKVIRKNVWEDIFEPYFSITQNFNQIITDFIKNRNHIAHNKPITLSAHCTFADSFVAFDNMIKDANRKFEESVPSDELYLTIDIQNEEAQEAAEQEEYEKNYLRDRISGETGVEILWRDSILEMFVEKADTIYQTFHDLFYWDNRFTFGPLLSIEDNEGVWQPLFSVSCNANENYYIEVQVNISIDDEMDGDSVINFRYAIHGIDNSITYSNEIGASIYYHNGNGYENVYEGKIELYSDSSLNEEEIENFVEELHTAIEEFNPYIAMKESMEYSSATEGGPRPVADFPCDECGKLGVSICEDFYTYGHCCYCGYNNDIKFCPQCESHFINNGDSSGLCDNCIEHIEKQ